MSETKFVELEFKYYADDIRLTEFEDFCKTRQPDKFVLASGYDHFFEKTKERGSFCRHRVGPDSNQLTFKRKTSATNNYLRTEHNLNLSSSTSEEQVKALLKEFGYAQTTTIFKTCFVYKYSNYTLVYYIVADLDHKELGRFIEIEMAEDYPWGSLDAARTALLQLESELSYFGVTPQARLKRSLFEMFSKGQ